jgi:hypothetical protein
MKVKSFFTIAAVVTLIFGLGFLITASWTTNLFGITIDTGGVLMTQLLGAAFLGFAVLNWMARSFAVPQDVHHIILANFVADAVGFVVALWQKLNGTGNAWFWLPVALYLLFALAFGYFYLTRSEVEEYRVKARHA